jgi:PLP dependent protein
MSFNLKVYRLITCELDASNTTLVAVSKTKPVEDITQAYKAGQLDFGENYVQEVVEKHELLPKNIRWHFIGHLQRNKVKYIAPFIYLIHGVDSLKLLNEINKQGVSNNRRINCLLQLHISDEETKFGFLENELGDIMAALKSGEYFGITVKGMMGMASFTNDESKIRAEFKYLASKFEELDNVLPDKEMWDFEFLSMGMSADYKVAIEQGSNMVRIGSRLFGKRN